MPLKIKGQLEDTDKNINRDDFLNFLEQCIKQECEITNTRIEKNAIMLENSLFSGSLFILGEIYNWNILKDLSTASFFFNKDGKLEYRAGLFGIILMNSFLLAFVFIWNFGSELYLSSILSLQIVINSIMSGIFYSIVVFPVLSIAIIIEVFIIKFRLKKFLKKQMYLFSKLNS